MKSNINMWIKMNIGERQSMWHTKAGEIMRENVFGHVS